MEIGGYAFELDKKFATALANAGGMQMQMDLRADTSLSSGNKDYSSALGVVRSAVWAGTRVWGRPTAHAAARPGWARASRRPSRRAAGGSAWPASPDRYEGRFSVQFADPLLVRCAVDYAPRRGAGGPCFRHEFVLTPDGVLSTLTRTSGTGRWGVTLPLLENDGAPLEMAVQAPAGYCQHPVSRPWR